MAAADSTQFDQLVSKLGIAGRPDCWVHHERVRHFVRANYKFRYVPEFLLDVMGLEILDVNLCGGREHG
jgi:hypothetical protein